MTDEPYAQTHARAQLAHEDYIKLCEEKGWKAQPSMASSVPDISPERIEPAVMTPAAIRLGAVGIGEGDKVSLLYVLLRGFESIGGEGLDHVGAATDLLNKAALTSDASAIEDARAEDMDAPTISMADMEVALRRLRMEMHTAGATTGALRTIDDLFLSVISLERLAQLVTTASAETRAAIRSREQGSNQRATSGKGLPNDPNNVPKNENIERDRAFEKLILTSKLLLQNAEGCAASHYGDDFAIHGEPGWLADCRADIVAAEAIRSSKAAAAEPPREKINPRWRTELDEIVGHLGSAIAQSCAKDDQIIMDHVRAAHEIAKIVRRQA